MNKYIIIALLFFTNLSYSTNTVEQKPTSNPPANPPAQNQNPQTVAEIPLSALGCTLLTSLDKDLCDSLISQAPQDVQDLIILIDEIKETKNETLLKNYINALPKKILFTGKAGVGKTTLAHAIAQKMNRKAFLIRAPMLGNEYQNSEISNLARIIKDISRLKQDIVFIIDEINILAEPKISTKGEGANNAASALWLALDFCSEFSNILVIGTANDITKLPPQLKDRFEGSIIEIKMDDFASRYNVLNHYLSKRQHYISDDYLKALAHKTRDFSPRQLEALIAVAAQNQAIRSIPDIISRAIYSLEPELLKFPDTCMYEEDIEKAYDKFLVNIQLLKPSVTVRCKEFFRELSSIAPGLSMTLNVGCLAVGLTYAVLKGKNPLAR